MRLIQASNSQFKKPQFEHSLLVHKVHFHGISYPVFGIFQVVIKVTNLNLIENK